MPCSRRPRSFAVPALRGTRASTAPPTRPLRLPTRRRRPATEKSETGPPDCGNHARAAASLSEIVHNDQYFLFVLISDLGHCRGPVLLSITTGVIGDNMLRRRAVTGFVIAVIAALLLTACGVTKGDEAR